MIKRALIGVCALFLSISVAAVDWYTATGAPATGAQGSSATMRNEFSLINAATNKLPTLTGNGSEVVVVNSGGTALESTPTVAVSQGGTGAATLTDGGILLGSGTGAITPMTVLIDGQIVIGDGVTDPTTLSAFTSSTGQLKHEYGGLEANVSAVVDGDFVVGTGTGTIGLESGATARATMGLGSMATQNSNAVSITGGDATSLTNLSTTNLSIGGTAVTATATELNYTDVTTPGIAQASKALVLGANTEISNVGHISSVSDSMSLNPSPVPSSNTGFELGNTGGQATASFIDFHSGAVAVDYDARITTASGTGVSGGAFLDIVAGQVRINNNIVYYASGIDVAIADGGTGASTANAAKENLGIYHGRIFATGTSLRLPAGWSSSKTATGNYTVTHNLGTSNNSIVVSCYDTSASLCYVEYGSGAHQANSFNIDTTNLAGTAVDRSFIFTLIND